MDRLKQLSALIAERNSISTKIAAIIGRPAHIGHLGEFIASELFEIDLEDSANNKGFDGRFTNGPLAGKTVNVKTYSKREGLIDLKTTDLPDYYLVLSGPRGPATSSKGQDRPFLLAGVHLFNASELVQELLSRNLKVGVATSVAARYWDAAEVYPTNRCDLLVLNEQQCDWLKGFGKHHVPALSEGC